MSSNSNTNTNNNRNNHNNNHNNNHRNSPPPIQVSSRETLEKLKLASQAQAKTQSLGTFRSHNSNYGNFLIPILRTDSNTEA